MEEWHPPRCHLCAETSPEDIVNVEGIIPVVGDLTYVSIMNKRVVMFLKNTCLQGESRMFIWDLFMLVFPSVRLDHHLQPICVCNSSKDLLEMDSAERLNHFVKSLYCLIIASITLKQRKHSALLCWILCRGSNGLWDCGCLVVSGNKRTRARPLSRRWVMAAFPLLLIE